MTRRTMPHRDMAKPGSTLRLRFFKFFICSAGLVMMFHSLLLFLICSGNFPIASSFSTFHLCSNAFLLRLSSPFLSYLFLMWDVQSSGAQLTKKDCSDIPGPSERKSSSSSNPRQSYKSCSIIVMNSSV